MTVNSSTRGSVVTETFGKQHFDLVGNQGIVFNVGNASKQDGGGDFIFDPTVPKIVYWRQSPTTDRSYESCLTNVGAGQWAEIHEQDIVPQALACSKVYGAEDIVAYVQITEAHLHDSPATLSVDVWFVRAKT